MFRIKATSWMHRLGLCACVQSFAPPAIPFRTRLWWTCVQGLQLATLQAAAWHPVPNTSAVTGLS